MLNIKIKENERQIKNRLVELTIEDFEKLCKTILEEEDIIDKYLNVLSILGMVEEDLDLITPEEFLTIIKQIKIFEENIIDFKKELIIDGKTYTAYTGDKFILSVRDLAKIEKQVKNKDYKFMGEILAILYKDLTLSKEQQYNKDYITARAELFRKKVTADIIYPYLNLIVKDLTTTIANGLS